MSGMPDPKPPARVRDPELLKELHRVWTQCELCLSRGHAIGGLSLHHIHRHPRDDVCPNLIMFCGSGTTGCHGLIEAHDRETCAKLAVHLIRVRLDTMEYLGEKLGGVVAVREWLVNQLYAPI